MQKKVFWVLILGLFSHRADALSTGQKFLFGGVASVLTIGAIAWYMQETADAIPLYLAEAEEVLSDIEAHEYIRVVKSNSEWRQWLEQKIAEQKDSKEIGIMLNELRCMEAELRGLEPLERAYELAQRYQVQRDLCAQYKKRASDLYQVILDMIRMVLPVYEKYRAQESLDAIYQGFSDHVTSISQKELVMYIEDIQKYAATIYPLSVWPLVDAAEKLDAMRITLNALLEEVNRATPHKDQAGLIAQIIVLRAKVSQGITILTNAPEYLQQCAFKRAEDERKRVEKTQKAERERLEEQIRKQSQEIQKLAKKLNERQHHSNNQGGGFTVRLF